MTFAPARDHLAVPKMGGVRKLAGPLMSVLVALGALTACGGADARPLSGMVRTPTPVISIPDTFDETGKPVAMKASGPSNLLLVYFGYTSCPDVCPTTLADLNLALGEIGDDAQRVEVEWITIDPARDTQSKMADYLASFLKVPARPVRIVDVAALAAVAAPLGATYHVSSAADGTVEVSHSAFLYAVDSAGRLLVQWPFGTKRDEIARDLRSLLAQVSKEN